MTRRTTYAAPPEAETAANDSPDLPGVPKGVAADVTVKYKTNVEQPAARSRELDELAELAGMDDGEDLPLDEVSEFCHRWQNFAGQLLSIVRLPDPPERRMPGNAYVHPCFNAERLGDTTFDPSSLISTLQFVNRNSGGVFRIWLNYNGAPVPEARLERIAIADPVGSQITNPAAPAFPSAPIAPQYQERPKSEGELALERTKEALFNRALERALNPPPPVTLPAANGNGLEPEQQATLFLLGKTDFLGSIFGKMADLAQQTAGAAQEPSLRDRAMDAGIELIKSNPAIVNRLSDVAERLVARIFGHDPRFDGQAPPPDPRPQGYAPAPQPQPPQPARAAEPTGIPEAPTQDDDFEDEEIMDILEALTTYLNSAEPLSVDHPAIQAIYRRYPIKFRLAVQQIISLPLDVIVDWIKETGGPVYVSLLEGPASGPYLRERLDTLRILLIEGAEHAKQKKQATAASDAATEV